MTIEETKNYIDSFLKLPKGWHFGDGIPASLDNVDTAKLILFVARGHGIDVSEAFPGIDGEIGLHLYLNAYTFRCEIESRDVIHLRIEKIKDENGQLLTDFIEFAEIENLDFTAIAKKLIAFAELFK